MARVWNRKKERAPRGAVYVGRPSKWGNPWSDIPGTVDPDHLVESRGEAVSKYREHLESHPEIVAEARKELLGLDLVCSCVPLPCHASVLFELVNAPERP